MQTDMDAIKLEGTALGELYIRHAPEALRLAYLLTGDSDLSEDLVQDAFVRLAGRMAHIRFRGAFHAYLRMTLVNLIRSKRRRKAVERRFAERRAPTEWVEPPDLSDRDEMRAALLSLPVRQRTAIVLRYYEDLSESETARLMRCRPGAVKSLVSRGITTLRAMLGDH